MSKLQGISPQVPLVYDPVDGPYRLNKTIGQAIKQNFKNLILTSPGERIMEPEFGVGLRQYLFENVNGDLLADLVARIKQQTSAYIPAIQLESIDFITSDEDPSLSLNQISTVITYNIMPVNAQDQLQITSTMTS
jgi:phage baseplate assembly protein W